jgi:hypothetical protein
MTPEKYQLITPLRRLSSLWNKEIDWAASERLEHLDYINETFDTGLASQLDLDTLIYMQEIYRDAFTLTIRIAELDTLLLHPGFTQDQLIEFRRNIAGSPYVTLSLRINKQKLAEIYYSEILAKVPEEKVYYLYLYQQSCEQYLSKCRLEDFEKYLWKDKPSANVVMLLPDTDIHLAGARLLIIGGTFLSSGQITPINHYDEILANTAYKVCRDNLKWQESWLNFLTPWHLFVKGESDPSYKIKNILTIAFANAALLFTADQTFLHTIQNQNRISRFSSPDKQVEVSHWPISTDLTIAPDQVEQVKEILDWIYDTQWPAEDRLTLAQQNIVDQLGMVDEKDRFLAVFQKSKTIRQNIKWHWETFTQKNINAYLGVVKNLEEYLSDVADGYSKNIATIQKSLTDTVLAAIGVSIGYFIASLFANPFNPSIFRIGIITYGLYVLCFPLYYNMKQQWKGYQSYQVQIAARKTRFLECLTQTKVDDIWNAWKIDDIHNQFISQFRWAVGIYLFIFIISVVVAFAIPGLGIPSIAPLISPIPTLLPGITPTVLPTLAATP